MWCVAFGAAVLAFLNYGLAAGRSRTNLVEVVAGAGRSYSWGYDRLYRLTNEVISGAGPAGVVGYRYDGVGNRTNRSSTVSGLTNQSFTYNVNDWLIGNVYDANGNTRTNGGNVFFCDVEDRLTEAVVNGVNVLLAYNGDGIRVKKTVGPTNIYYLVDDRNLTGYAQVLEEHQSVSGGAAVLNRVYNYGLDLISQCDVGGAIYYFIYDGHGSTRALVDGNGNVVNVFVYDAWGNLIGSNTSPQTVYLYTGEQYDADLGLYYLRARYLNTGTGRFWTRDKWEGHLQEPLSLHRYLYCQGDSVNKLDPGGCWTLPDVLTATFTIANVASRVYVSYQVGRLIGTGIRFTYDEEMTFDELLDESLKTGMEIAGGWAIGRGVGFAFNRWIGPLTRKLTPLVWQRAHQLGRAAEASILARYNMFKNSKSLAELGGRGDFVPDGITSDVLREVKNVARLQLDDQIRAFAIFCKDTGRKFVIHVRPSTKVDGTVVNEMEKVFGSGSRGSAWDIVSDIPEEMRIATQLAR